VHFVGFVLHNTKFLFVEFHSALCYLIRPSSNCFSSTHYLHTPLVYILPLMC